MSFDDIIKGVEKRLQYSPDDAQKSRLLNHRKTRHAEIVAQRKADDRSSRPPFENAILGSEKQKG